MRPGRWAARPSAALVELAERCRAGDRDAFTQLYQFTVTRITGYVAARMRDRDRDAIDDLVQDTYCTALAEPHLLGDDPIGALLRLAARACTCHDWSRRRYVRAAYQVYADTARPAENPAPLPATAPPAVLMQAMAGLRRDQRRALTLRYIDGYPRDRAAAIMRRSVAAMTELERRARAELRRAVGEPPTTAQAVLVPPAPTGA
jgi:RNA polymerase sigma-70 factor (ECF subfamily)